MKKSNRILLVSFFAVLAIFIVILFIFKISLKEQMALKGVTLSTHNGRINVNRQVPVTGEIDNRNFNGCIGDCTGRISLRPRNGDVMFR